MKKFPVMKKAAVGAGAPAGDGGATPDPILWAAGNYQTPHRLAMQQMRAVMALLFGLVAALGGGWATIRLEMMPAPVAVGVVIWLLTAIYAATLLRHLRNVERTLWRVEEHSGVDLDGDGWVGPPPERRTLQIDGETVPFGAEWHGDEPTVGTTGQPPAVVRRFLLRAKEVGLARSAWLPENGPRTTLEGVQVSRGVWRDVTDWLVAIGWATNNGKGLVLVKPVGWCLHQLDEAEARLAEQAAGRQRAGSGQAGSGS